MEQLKLGSIHFYSPVQTTINSWARQILDMLGEQAYEDSFQYFVYIWYRSGMLFKAEVNFISRNYLSLSDAHPNTSLTCRSLLLGSENNF
jgi:hypothetical protein